jgi:hypothetical protein
MLGKTGVIRAVENEQRPALAENNDDAVKTRESIRTKRTSLLLGRDLARLLFNPLEALASSARDGRRLDRLRLPSAVAADGAKHSGERTQMKETTPIDR